MALVTHIKFDDEKVATRLWYCWRAIASRPAALEAIRRLVEGASVNWALSVPDFLEVGSLLTAPSIESFLKRAPTVLVDCADPRYWALRLKQSD